MLKQREYLPEKILADRLEDILASMRRTATWLEAIGREDLLGQLAERFDTMGRQRLIEHVCRLMEMSKAFLKYAEGSGASKHNHRFSAD